MRPGEPGIARRVKFRGNNLGTHGRLAEMKSGFVFVTDGGQRVMHRL